MEGSRALCSSSVPPESIVGEAWCQPCAINHPLSEEGRQGGDPPPRTGGWKFSCPPRLLKPHATTDRTPTAGLAIRDRPGPKGPCTASTAASPLPSTTPSTQLYKICIRTGIYCHSFTFLHKNGHISEHDQFHYIILCIVNVCITLCGFQHNMVLQMLFI